MKNNKGFSLLELLVYIAITATVTLAIAGIFVYFNKGRGLVEARTQVNSNLNFALEKISQDIRNASSITLPVTANTSTSQLSVVVSGSTITYCVESGQIRRETGASCGETSSTITSNSVAIDTLSFNRIENTNTILSKTAVGIEINISAGYNSDSPDWQYSGSKKTTVSLR